MTALIVIALVASMAVNFYFAFKSEKRFKRHAERLVEHGDQIIGLGKWVRRLDGGDLTALRLHQNGAGVQLPGKGRSS